MEAQSNAVLPFFRAGGHYGETVAVLAPDGLSYDGGAGYLGPLRVQVERWGTAGGGVLRCELIRMGTHEAAVFSHAPVWTVELKGSHRCLPHICISRRTAHGDAPDSGTVLRLYKRAGTELAGIGYRPVLHLCNCCLSHIPRIVRELSIGKIQPCDIHGRVSFIDLFSAVYLFSAGIFYF